jgi:hypothetical protein
MEDQVQNTRKSIKKNTITLNVKYFWVLADITKKKEEQLCWWI